MRPIGPDIDLAAFERAMRNAMAGKPLLIDEARGARRGEALMARIGARNAARRQACPTSSKVNVGLLVGIDVGRSLAPIKDEFDLPVLMQAMRTAFAGGKPLLTRRRGDRRPPGLHTKRKQAQSTPRAAGVAHGQPEGGRRRSSPRTSWSRACSPRQVRPAVHGAAPGRRPAPEAGRPGARATIAARCSTAPCSTVPTSAASRPSSGSSQVIAGWTEGVR